MATVNYFDWNMGVTDETLHKGIIKNTNYIAGSGLKKYFSGDQEFSFIEDDDPIKNYQILEGSLLPAGNTLDVEIIPSTGSDTYTLKDCYDIKHVARYIKSGIETVISTSEIKIPFGPFKAISKYDSRFTTNNLGGILACRITNTSTNDEYLRSFTVSGNNIILRDINPDTSGVYQISGITGISTSWRFELISAFDIVKSGTELESVFQGYVIKTIENGEGTIKFTKYDAPEKADNEFIAITYIKLQSIKPQEVNMVSILQHDIYTDTKKIDFALNQSQLDLLKENLLKYINPLKKVVLKTRRPTVLKRGDEVYFKVTDVIEDILKVVDYSEDYIHKNGELNNKPFKEITYIFANYFDDFAKLLSTFQLKDEINKIQLAKKQKFNYLSEIIISCTNQLNTDGNAIFVSKPIFTGYEFTNVNSEPQDNNLTITWQTVPETTNYYIEISLNDIFTHLISAGNTGNYTEISTYSDFTINNNNFYARLKAEKNGLFSDWSDVLEINKVNYEERIIFNSNKSGQWQTWSMKPDGTNQINITNDNTKEDHYTTYNLAIDSYIFSRRISGILEICKKDRATGVITQITSNSSHDCLRPAVSDNGSLISFHRNNQVVIINNTGTQLYSWSPTSYTIDLRSSSKFNSDNTKILICESTYPNYQISLYNIDGTGKINLSSEFGALTPVFNSDYSKILYRVSDLGLYDSTSVMNIDGTGKTRVNNTSSIEEEFPCYSIDNLEYLFIHPAYEGNIYKSSFVSPNTSVNLTNTSDLYELNDGWKQLTI